MPKTGDHSDSHTAGIYRCEGCGERIQVVLGREFPDCPKERAATTWILVAPAGL